MMHFPYDQQPDVVDYQFFYTVILGEHHQFWMDVGGQKSTPNIRLAEIYPVNTGNYAGWLVVLFQKVNNEKWSIHQYNPDNTVGEIIGYIEYLTTPDVEVPGWKGSVETMDITSFISIQEEDDPLSVVMTELAEGILDKSGFLVKLNSGEIKQPEKKEWQNEPKTD